MMESDLKPWRYTDARRWGAGSRQGAKAPSALIGTRQAGLMNGRILCVFTSLREPTLQTSGQLEKPQRHRGHGEKSEISLMETRCVAGVTGFVATPGLDLHELRDSVIRFSDFLNRFLRQDAKVPRISSLRLRVFASLRELALKILVFISVYRWFHKQNRRSPDA